MKRLAWLMPLAFCGCLLQQTDPAPVRLKGILEGTITVETMQVANQGAVGEIRAGFEVIPVEKPAPKPAVNFASRHGRMAAVSAFAASSASRAPDCERVSGTIAPEPEVDPDAPPPVLPWVDVGTIVFGPLMQGSATLLPKNKHHLYGAQVSAALPSGVYQFAASGTAEVDPFEELVAFPEAVADLRLNGKNFGDPTLKLGSNGPVTVFWRAPAISNDRYNVLLNFILQDGDQVHQLICQKPEEGVSELDGYKEWEVDPRWFSEFPDTGKVQFYMIRAQVMQAKRRLTDIKVFGLRTYYSNLDWIL